MALTRQSGDLIGGMRNTVDPFDFAPAGLSQYVLSSSNSSQQQALQTLPTSLAPGDVNSPQWAFLALQAILQNSAPVLRN